MIQNLNSQVSINRVENALIVNIYSELYDEVITKLKAQLLKTVYNEHITGIIIDLSLVEIIDSFVLRVLVDIADMAKLMGAKTYFSGMKPEIVASLVDFGKEVSNIQVVLNVDEGLRKFKEMNL
jgi:rsbT antagonist protein RsbS